MPWERPTLSQLIERIENDITSRLTGNAPLLRRSLLKILARCWAGLAHILHGFLNYLSKQLFVSTAETSYLDIHAADWGLTRAPATYAEGVLTVTGTNGETIPDGLIFISETGLEYSTIDGPYTIVGGQALVTVRANVAGEDGNLDVGAILTIQTSTADVDDEATVSTEIAGGVDQESDDTLRERVTLRIRNPPAGGSKSDYVRWALSVAGVANAWVHGSYYGMGTVAVVIKAEGDDPEPAPSLVSEVQDYIDQDDVRPITAAVTVVGLTTVTIDITLSITPDTTALRDAIEEALTTLLDSDIEPGGDFFLSHIQQVLMQVGVQDYAISVIEKDSVPIFDLDSPSETYTFPDFEYPVLGTITWT